MFGKLLLALTSMAYIALVAINFYKPKGTGDQLVGWGFIVMLVLAAYGLLSLLLTVNLAVTGKFDWISESLMARFFIISVGWLCFTAGIVYITFINGDLYDLRSANWLGMIIIYFGAVWVPLLMLVPYFYLLNSEGPAASSANVIKIPLLAGSIIGAVFLLFSKQQLSGLFRNNQGTAELEYEKNMADIESATGVDWLLYHACTQKDVRLVEAASTKLKNMGNLDSAFIAILNNCESTWDYTRVYAYLENNNVEQPELFTEPLNYTIGRVATELQFRLHAGGNQYGFLEMLNVDGLCHILDTQFKAHKNEFRPNMLRIREELDKEPEPEYLEIRNRYKAAIDKWLATQ